MHVSNLLTAVRALNTFADSKGTISPFCTWAGDAHLHISKALNAAHITGADGKLADGVTSQEAVTAVLLLVALRAQPLPIGSQKPEADFVAPLETSKP